MTPTYAHLRRDAHEDSVWVYIRLPADVCAALEPMLVGDDDERANADGGGVGPHATLVYLGSRAKFTDAQIDAGREAVRRVAAEHAPLQFRFTGAGKFVQSKQSDSLTPVYLVPSAPGLAALRTDLLRALKDAGLEKDSPFDFAPHVCLGYVKDSSHPVPSEVPDVSWTTDAVSFMVNPACEDMPLSGTRKDAGGVPDVDSPFSSMLRGKDVCSPVSSPEGKRRGMPVESAYQGGRKVARTHLDIIEKHKGQFVLKSHEGKTLGGPYSEEEARAQESAINISKARAAGHHIAKPKDFDDYVQKVQSKQNVGDPDLEQEGVPERRGNKWVWLKNGEVAGEYDLDNEKIHITSTWANTALGERPQETGSRAAELGTSPDVTEPLGEMPKLVRKDCKRYDVGLLDKPVKLPNGWLRCDAFIARSGVYRYRNADGSDRFEYRPPSEVFHPNALSSFGMRPVTDDHPPVFLDAKNTQKYQRGNMSDAITRDDQLVRGSMMVTDGVLIGKMESGDQVQVSCGYTCDLEPTSGVTDDGERYDCIQRNIRGNHVAIVPVARAGEVAHVRMDSAAAVMVRIQNGREDSSRIASEGVVAKKISVDGKQFVLGSKEATAALKAQRERLDSMKKELEAKIAERADDGEGGAEHGEYLNKLKDALDLHAKAKQMHDAVKALHDAACDKHDEVTSALEEQYEKHKKLLEEQQHKADALEAENAELKKRLDGAPTTAVEAFKARQSLEQVARLVLGKKEKLDGIADKVLKQKIVLKELPDVDVKKLDDAHLDAYFDVAMSHFEEDKREDGVVLDDVTTEDLEPGDPRRFDGMTPEWANKRHTDREEARAAMEYRSREAWKQPLAPTRRDLEAAAAAE